MDVHRLTERAEVAEVFLTVHLKPNDEVCYYCMVSQKGPEWSRCENCGEKLLKAKHWALYQLVKTGLMRKHDRSRLGGAANRAKAASISRKA